MKPLVTCWTVFPVAYHSDYRFFSLRDQSKCAIDYFINPFFCDFHRLFCFLSLSRTLAVLVQIKGRQNKDYESLPAAYQIHARSDGKLRIGYQWFIGENSNLKRRKWAILYNTCFQKFDRFLPPYRIGDGTLPVDPSSINHRAVAIPDQCNW